MKYRFANIFLKKNALLSQSESKIDDFLLENNKSQLQKIYDFYENTKDKILFVNGFLGSGKADIVKHSTTFINDDVITLKYNCFNSTILDDILLAFFKEFKDYAKTGIITNPRIKTDNFTEKINSYFATIEKPFLIILDSFEAILDENRQEILDFIFHVLSTDKAKVIIIGRYFNEKLFPQHNVKRITTLAFEKRIFEKFLKSKKIKASSSIIEDFFKYTRGYYYYTYLSANIINAQKITLEQFIAKMKDTFTPFEKLIEKELLSLINPSATHLFWFLILIRHGISCNLLKKLELYNEELIEELIKYKIIVKEGENLYIQDYFDAITDFAPQNRLMKLRQYLVSIYQSQLPLKPFERDIYISRQTMRKEIEYHNTFLPKKNFSLDSNPEDINYLSYSKVFNTQNNPIQQPTDKKNNSTQISENKSKVDLSQRKNVSLNLESLKNTTSSQSENLSKIPEITSKTTQAKENFNEDKPTFKGLIVLIKKAEKLYKYTDVLELAQQALAMQTAAQYNEMLPFIYAKIANAYTKTAQYDKALSYYHLLVQMYNNQNDKTSQINFKIANIYYETYKISQAKSIFLEIVETKGVPSSIILNAYLKLINIAEEQKTADEEILQYFKDAIAISSEVKQENLLAELYFKFALMLDDQNNVDNAKKYYQKCIKIDTDENIFISSAYSNLASIALEDNNINLATELYQKAFDLDKKFENYDGAYDSASKLADIFRRRDSNKAIEFYTKALEFANKTEDIIYIITSALEFGDFYYEIKKDELALEFYLYAFNVAKDKTSKENIDTINLRLNDVKFRMGEKTFNDCVQKINNKNNFYE